MVTQLTEDTREVFSAVSDPIRRAILDRLRNQEVPAGEIASKFTVSRPAISKHLRILRESGLIVERRAGRERRYRLQPEGLHEVDRWIEQYRMFWEKSLMNLKELVESESDTEA